MANPVITPSASEIIQRLGGTSSTARFFIVSKSAVSQWLKNGVPPDKVRILKAERPEIFTSHPKRPRTKRVPTEPPQQST